MLYHLFDYIDNVFDFPGAGVFRYTSFRAGMAALFSMIITITFGETIINCKRKKSIGETVRELRLKGQLEKKGTPTMGGLMIIAAIVVPTLLFANIYNIYIILLLVTTLWLGGIGFTMSLFIAALAFENAVLLTQAKLGILTASVCAGAVGWLLLRRGAPHIGSET
jgi:UDP-N-acetylmuramyl pentapeptide phosphotransferase/UDP-N-acetylglucosamine-1-phosphate transferase